jgi:hypothetical protein
MGLFLTNLKKISHLAAPVVLVSGDLHLANTLGKIGSTFVKKTGNFGA